MDEGLYWTIEWEAGDSGYQEFLIGSEESAMESYASKLLRVPDLKEISLSETDFYGEPYRLVESHTIA